MIIVFAESGEKLQSDVSDWSKRYQKFMATKIINSFYLEPVCEDDSQLEIRWFHQKKSPDPDSIGSKMIQLCPEIFADNLRRIFSHAIRKDAIHMIWNLLR